MDIARRLLPKEFFWCLNQKLRLKKKSALVKHFKSKIVDGTITSPPNLGEYLGNLYKSDDIIPDIEMLIEDMIP